MSRKSVATVGLLLLSAGAVPTASAALYWDTDGATAGLQSGNGVWDTGTTSAWSADTGGTAPTTWQNGNDALFQTGGSNDVTLDGTIQANSISLSSDTTLILSGGTLNLEQSTTTNAINVTNGSVLTINSNLVAANDQIWGASVLTVNGDITAAGSVTLGNTGTRFSTFHGQTNITGMLSLSGSGGSPVLLTLGGPATVGGVVRLSGAGTRLFAGGDLTASSIEFGAAAIAALGGNNTFTSGSITTSSGGTLFIERDENLGGVGTSFSFGNSSTLRILGTTMTSFGSRSVSYGGTNGDDPVIEIADATHTFTFNDVIAMNTNSTFVKGGAGTVILNQANTSSGTYAARGGLLNLDAGAGGSINSEADLEVRGGTFQLTGAPAAITTQVFSATVVSTYGGTIRVDGGTSTTTTLDLGAITANATSSALNFVTTGSSPTITTTTPVDPTGIYSGRITFNGADWATTTAGAVSPYAGYATLATAAGTDTQNSQITADGITTLAAGAHATNTLKIANDAAGVLDIGGGNSLVLTGGGLLFTGTADYEISGGTVNSGLLSAANTSDLVIHQNGTGVLTISSAIANGTGASTLTKTGPGTLVLTATNLYTGQTYINGGTLSGADFGGTISIFGGANAATAVNINGGTLQYTGESDSTSRLMDIGNNGATIDVVGEGVVLTWSGNIANTAGAGSLTKTGAGTLLLTTSSNDFTGGVFINQGVLQTGASGSLNRMFPNTVTFGAGSTGTLRLGGVSVTVEGLKTDGGDPGATFVENGAAGAATLTVSSVFASTYGGTIRDGDTGALSLVKSGGNTFTVTGNNSYSGGTSVDSGTLAVAGNGSLGTGDVSVTRNGRLTLQGSGNLAIGDSATLSLANGAVLDIDGNESVGILVLGSIVFNSPTIFDSGNGYQGFGESFFSGSTGALTVVPEPASLGLAGLAAGLLLGRRRRRTT